MIELDKAENKKLDLVQIKEIYNPDYMLSRRLKQMIDSKYIIEDSGFYKNIGKGCLVAKIAQFLKEYLQLGEGG